MKTGKKIVLSIVAIILVMIVIGAVQFSNYIKDGSAKLEAIVFEGVDLSEVENGVYEGDYDTGIIYAKVKAIVNSGKIESLELLEHKNGKGGPAEVVVDQIVKQQMVEVDDISGATGSSRVIKKAVEVALKKGIQ